MQNTDMYITGEQKKYFKIDFYYHKFNQKMNYTNIKENPSVNNLALYFFGVLFIIIIVFIVLVIQIIKKNKVSPEYFQNIPPDV